MLRNPRQTLPPVREVFRDVDSAPHCCDSRGDLLPVGQRTALPGKSASAPAPFPRGPDRPVDGILRRQAVLRGTLDWARLYLPVYVTVFYHKFPFLSMLSGLLPRDWLQIGEIDKIGAPDARGFERRERIGPQPESAKKPAFPHRSCKPRRAHRFLFD